MGRGQWAGGLRARLHPPPMEGCPGCPRNSELRVERPLCLRDAGRGLGLGMGPGKVLLGARETRGRQAAKPWGPGRRGRGHSAWPAPRASSADSTAPDVG